MDELDDKLQAMAREYQEPPPFDRERVWNAIAAQRRAATTGAPRPGVVRLAPGRRALARRAATWGSAIAAVLAIGFVLGRRATPAGELSRPASVASTPADPATALSVAAAGHIRQAETYLTLFRASARRGTPDTTAIPVARELLATNRLLASAPGTDPGLRQLLLDLEFVLVQITQLEGRAHPGDVQLITDGLEHSGTLTRLRTATPRIPVSLSTGVS